jgi:regulatory protein YycI of two-component signal transduction system YycFG
MAEHAHTFLLVTILVLVTILLVFGMKYFSAARRDNARVTREDVYRELAAQAVSVQSDVSEMKLRLTAIEKLLREVE